MSTGSPSERASDRQPASPLTELAASAVGMHEMYRTFVDAGFTQQEAIQILVGVILGRPQ